MKLETTEDFMALAERIERLADNLTWPIIVGMWAFIVLDLFIVKLPAIFPIVIVSVMIVINATLTFMPDFTRWFANSLRKEHEY